MIWCKWFHKEWWHYHQFYRHEEGIVADIISVGECKKCGRKWVRPAWETNNDRRA